MSGVRPKLERDLRGQPQARHVVEESLASPGLGKADRNADTWHLGSRSSSSITEGAEASAGMGGHL